MLKNLHLPQAEYLDSLTLIYLAAQSLTSVVLTDQKWAVQILRASNVYTIANLDIETFQIGTDCQSHCVTIQQRKNSVIGILSMTNI